MGDVFEGCAGPHYALVHERDAERLRAQNVPVELLTFEDFGPPLVGLVERLAGIARGSAVSAGGGPQLSAEGSATTPPRPFGDQGRITDPERFFDREEILQRIFEELAAGRNLSLVGEPQVGKFLASRSPLSELFPDSPLDTSPLAPICPEMRLPPFSRPVALRFLCQRMASVGRRFSEADEERMLNESGGHPGRLQALAHESYRRVVGVEEG